MIEDIIKIVIGLALLALWIATVYTMIHFAIKFW
jgi:hypothetical protein